MIEKKADPLSLFFKMSLDKWRPVCNRFGSEYLKAYQSHCQISAPEEEDDEGRLDLYEL